MIKLSFKVLTKVIVAVKVLTILFIIVVANIAMGNAYIEGKSFFTVVRIIVSTVSAISIYWSVERNDTKGKIFFIALAVIFNPIVPFSSFSKNVWLFIDMLAIAAFIYAIFNHFNYINNPEDRASLIKSDAGLPQSSRYVQDAQKYLELAITSKNDAANTNLYDDNRLQTALSLYRNALECDPKLYKAYIDIGYIILELQHKYDTNFDQAIDELEEAINLFPDKPELYKLRGMILLCKSRRIIASDKQSRAKLILSGINDLSEYLQTYPDDQHVNELKGESYYELEKIHPAAVTPMFLEVGLEGIGSWAEYYARKKQKYNPHHQNKEY